MEDMRNLLRLEQHLGVCVLPWHTIEVMDDDRPQLDVVLPVHDEAETIEQFVWELLEELNRHVVPRLIVCEDGSSDDTPQILQRLAVHAPMHVVTSRERKGYARALIDGLRVVSSSQVLVLDADGQCDPRDFPSFWLLRGSTDILIGWRQERADSFSRRVASCAFRAVYRMHFRAPVHDPSCPYALIQRASIDPLLDHLGLLEFGFWWELVARAQLANLTIDEVPIHHRQRAAGSTRAFTPRRLPKLAVSHLLGLGRLWLDTR